MIFLEPTSNVCDSVCEKMDEIFAYEIDDILQFNGIETEDSEDFFNNLTKEETAYLMIKSCAKIIKKNIKVLKNEIALNSMLAKEIQDSVGYETVRRACKERF